MFVVICYGGHRELEFLSLFLYPTPPPPPPVSKYKENIIINVFLAFFI